MKFDKKELDKLAAKYLSTLTVTDFKNKILQSRDNNPDMNDYSDEDFTNDSGEENNKKEENENTNKLIVSELLEIIDESSSEQITEDTIKHDEKSNSINQNNKKKNNCQNLFYYDINNNEINCLSNNEKICPDNYPYKSLIDN